MSYKAVIFDLDGTLLNTISDITDSFNEVLEASGYPQFTEADYKQFVGMGIDVLVEKVIAAGNIPKQKYAYLRQAYYDAYTSRQKSKTKPYDGIVTLLKKLNDLEIKISVLSNKPHSQTTEVVKHYFPDIEFALVYGKKPDFEIKPNPKSVLDIIDRMNIEKETILYVGDTATDMETAANAGLTSVGVLWGFRSRRELEQSGAKHIVETPQELLKIILGENNDPE